MRAVVFRGGKLKYEPTYEANSTVDHIAVRVLKAGICETDLQLIQGYMGFSGVLGHEFVGVAESGEYEGQRVVGEINCSCHQCETCRTGRANHCPYRTVIGILNHDGAFADRVWVPEANLHPIPDTVTDDEAVFVEPLAAAFQIGDQLDLRQFESVVVLGDGRLGNLCAKVLHAAGKQPTVVGKHLAKLSRLEQLGIKTELLSDVALSKCVDLVVDCTGSASGLTTAMDLVRPRGTIVLKTTTATEHGPNLAQVVIDEITLVGSRCGPFPKAIRALETDSVDVTSLITSRFPLEDAIHAFEVAQQKDQLKVMLDVA